MESEFSADNHFIVREMLTRFIEVNFQVEGVHRWKDCPHEDVKFLRDYHRHMFHFRVRVDVEEGDREIEFIRLKRKLTIIVESVILKGPTDLSCEMIAEQLLNFYLDGNPLKHGQSMEIFVSEDGENGGGISYMRSLI